ncbi:endonuclease/exonuclease/phosphatase family protein [Pricia sp. S334]|uniref:Endonuclease/exonuclease/phosphatase family protein n=1 Tax=Pricia mediterranea TaxID=3076079 RepID=A0ABU3L2C0_9FLAO|nr:endonuclease/exonuclease/phosphatase family protein [Pricia sp. S334]MDT7827431.1 endonuclease/exonuclease/phosphatase family protein [Pricia sp. S334]
MSWLEITTLILNLLFCVPTLASMTTLDMWWVRGFDFPRVQISVLILLNIILALFVYDFTETWHFIVIGALIFSLMYQFRLIFPYTVLANKQVIEYDGPENDQNISILVCNVLTPNRGYKALKELVKDEDPDLFLTLETDSEWEKALEPLEDTYIHNVKVPLDNLYGMHLYSKLPLKNMEVKYLVKDDIPSIHGTLELHGGKKVAIHCLHPRPPSPTESDTSTNRDAELLLVAREIDPEAGPRLVFGDFNDVAWSRTTRLFQKISGLLDPRQGRGFYNTYHADYRLLRWPLDHVFHTDDFSLVDLRRARNIGSDHFPMYIKLNYTPEAQWKQDAPEADDEEKRWADEKIEDAE